MSWLGFMALAAALLGSAPHLAGADQGTSRGGAVAGEDTNGDGVVSLREARAAAWRLFGRFDRDGDGVVTRAEASAPRGAPSRARLEARFAELDRDRNGRLSRWESRLPPRRFARVDRDADGRLSADELWRSAQRSRRGAGDSALPLLWRRDLDGDGRVTRAEVERIAERRFRQRDRDGDGQLTPRDAHAGRARASNGGRTPQTVTKFE
jgi:Ca2+-binding EF-hand superfamily protein